MLEIQPIAGSIGADLHGVDLSKPLTDQAFNEINQYLTWETLDDETKKMLDGMNAVHSSAMPHGREEARFGAVNKNRTPSKHDRKIDTTMAKDAICSV